MKIINTIVNAVIEILLTSISLGLIGGFGYILFTSGAIADAANLMPYLNDFSINILPMQGLVGVVAAVAIFFYLVKTTIVDNWRVA